MITLSQFQANIRPYKKKDDKITAKGLGSAALGGAGLGSLAAATVPANMPDSVAKWLMKGKNSKNVLRRNLAHQTKQSLVEGVAKKTGKASEIISKAGKRLHAPITSYPGATLLAGAGALGAGGLYLGRKLYNKHKNRKNQRR